MLFNESRYQVFGVVTNRTLPGEGVIHWHRERCGKSEAAHGVMKSDLAGGRMPSGLFGANAAWGAIVVLAFNLNALMTHRVLPEGWANQRRKRGCALPSSVSRGESSGMRGGSSCAWPRDTPRARCSWRCAAAS